MYRHLISQLYGGNIDPCGRTIDKTSKRFLQDRRIADLASTFRKSLTPEQSTMFEEYIAEHNYLDALIEEDGFIEGFRLGGQMVMAMLFGKDDATEEEEPCGKKEQ